MENVKPGIYKHFKGKFSLVTCVAKHSDDGSSLVIYLVLLFVGTAGKISLKSDVLKISFDFSHEWFSAYFSWFELSAGNILINLLLLFPIGFVVYTFSQQHPFVKTILIALGISAIIELYQWMLPVFRNSEVSDIIFNTISGVISACYCELLKKLGAFPKQGLLK